MAIDLPEDELLRLYRSGVPAVEIGLRYGTSPNTIRRRLQKNGAERPLTGTAVMEQIRSLYRSGLRIYEVAELMGTSDQTVNRRLRQMGEPIRMDWHQRPHGVRKDVDLEKVRELRAEGKSTRAIGEALGVSEECIRDRMVEADIPRLSTSFPGALNPAWKGGRNLDEDGYVLVFAPDHPNAASGRYVREHRLVMEKKLGRLLLQDEVVHHIDGNCSNNHPDNLELFSTNADHLRATLKGCVPQWTEDGLRRIRESHPARRAERESTQLSLIPCAPL